MHDRSNVRTLGSLSGLLAAALIAACTPAQIHEEPIIYQGGRVGTIEGTATASENAREREEMAARRDSIALAALATCAPDVCDAVMRGELALDMTETQVLAATRTTWSAWSVADAGGTTVMAPASLSVLPQDIVGPVAMVSLLVASGVGAMVAALNRYDRADILRPGDPMTTYRIATALDKELRPIQALVQYQLFLHQLELERIDAEGDAAAKLADAIAQARARIIFIERGGEVQQAQAEPGN